MVMVKLTDAFIGASKAENRKMLEEQIVPSVKMLVDLEEQGMLSGGFTNERHSAAMIVSVEDEDTLDDTLAQLPWVDLLEIEVFRLEPFKDVLEEERRAFSAPTKRTIRPSRVKR